VSRAPRRPAGHAARYLEAEGSHLLDRVEELLRARFDPRAIVRVRKPTYARPAPEDLRREVLETSDALGAIIGR
jgi:hypothetical protein